MFYHKTRCVTQAALFKCILHAKYCPGFLKNLDDYIIFKLCKKVLLKKKTTNIYNIYFNDYFLE